MSTESSAPDAPGATPAKAGGLVNSRHYALIILTLVYVSSFVDRQIMSILLQPVKEEFNASDLEMGILGGFAFAIFYATLGIPLAMIADRANRRNLIALSITVWSGMTALGGMAQNFTHLLLARIGVGVGEAGSGPASHSMIADLYPLAERTRAMAVYSTGIHIGGSLGGLIGGVVAFYWGWREAFMVVGLPGLLIAVLLRMTVKEPVRGQSEGVIDGPKPLSLVQAAKQVFTRNSLAPIMAGFRLFWESKTLRHTIIGCTLVAFIGYGAALYGPAYMIRMFGMNLRDIGILSAIGSVFAVAGGVGAAWVADHRGKEDPRWIPWIVAVTKLAALPFIIAYYFQDTLWVALLFYIPIITLAATYQGSTYSMVQTLSPKSMRAQSAAILLFVINLVGMGLGPTFVGAISDNLVSVVGDDTQSLRWALAIVSSIGVWGAYHYYLAGKYYPAELAAMQAREAEEEAAS
jgi:MFS family permease